MLRESQKGDICELGGASIWELAPKDPRSSIDRSLDGRCREQGAGVWGVWEVLANWRWGLAAALTGHTALKSGKSPEVLPVLTGPVWGIWACSFHPGASRPRL